MPWRFNVLVSQKIRPILVKKLLNSNVPVSDWYPVVTDLFSDNKYYNGGTQFQKTILNFPLLCSDEKIKNFAFIFNKIVEEFL